jgi:hypothetical protein
MDQLEYYHWMVNRKGTWKLVREEKRNSDRVTLYRRINLLVIKFWLPWTNYEVSSLLGAHKGLLNKKYTELFRRYIDDEAKVG